MFNDQTFEISIAEHKLGGRVSGFGCGFQKLYGLPRIIQRRIFGQIDKGQINRGFRIAEFGRFVKKLRRFGKILFRTDAAEIQTAQIINRNGVVLRRRHIIVGKSFFIIDRNTVFPVEVHIAKTQLRIDIALFGLTGNALNKSFFALVRQSGQFRLVFFQKGKIHKRKNAFVFIVFGFGGFFSFGLFRLFLFVKNDAVRQRQYPLASADFFIVQFKLGISRRTDKSQSRTKKQKLFHLILTLDDNFFD